MDQMKITMVVVKNPFDVTRDREIRSLTHIPGEPVQTYVRNALGGVILPDEEIYVVRGGRVLEDEEMTSIKPVPGEAYVVFPMVAGGGGQGDSKKQVLSIVASIALMAFSFGVGNLVQYQAMFGQATATGMAGWGTAARFAAMATQYIGGMLLNHLFPGPKQPKSEEEKTSYGWAINTQVQPGGAVQQTGGEFRTAGTLIAYHVTGDGETQYLNMLFSGGEGPCDYIGDGEDDYCTGISGIEINGNPVENYTNIAETKYFMASHSSGSWDAVVGNADIKDFKTGTAVTYYAPSVAAEHEVTTIVTNSDSEGGCVLIKTELPSPADLKQVRRNSINIFKRSGLNDQSPIPFFNDTFCTKTVGSILDVGSDWTIEETDGNGGEGLEMTIEFPGGLYKSGSDGSYKAASVNIEAEFSNDGGTTWNKWPLANDGSGLSRTISYNRKIQYWSNYQGYIKDHRSNAVRRTYRLNYVPVGRYMVRVRCTGKSGDGSGYSTQVLWSGLTSVVYDDLMHPNKILLGIRALATDQLSGGMPTVSWLQKRSNVWVYNPAANAYEERPANNPAWRCYEIIHGARRLKDSRTYEWVFEERGARKERMDYQAFSDWAAACEEKGLVANYIHSDLKDLWDALKPIEEVGRGKVILKGTKFSCVFDSLVQEPSQMFDCANMLNPGFSMDYMSVTERANAIEITFPNVAKNFESDTITVFGPDWDKADTVQNPTQIQLDACTSYQQALREGRYRLNVNQHIRRTGSWSADIDAIACGLGDVVAVQNEMTDWGVGGRLMSASTQMVTMDKTVTMEPGKNYAVRVRLDDDTQLEKGVLTEVPVFRRNSTRTGPSGEFIALDEPCWVDSVPGFGKGILVEDGLNEANGNIRADETLIVPLSGLRPSAGSWEQLVLINDAAKRRVPEENPRVFRIPKMAGNGEGIELYSNGAGSQWVLKTNSDQDVWTQGTLAHEATPNGWYRVRVCWDNSVAKAEFYSCSDKKKAGGIRIEQPALPSAFGVYAEVGWDSRARGNALNTAHDDIRLSSITRGENDDPGLENPLCVDAQTIRKVDFQYGFACQCRVVVVNDGYLGDTDVATSVGDYLFTVNGDKTASYREGKLVVLEEGSGQCQPATVVVQSTYDCGTDSSTVQVDHELPDDLQQVRRGFTMPRTNDLFLFGEVNKLYKMFRVIGIERDGDLRRKIYGVEYDPRVYDGSDDVPVEEEKPSSNISLQLRIKEHIDPVTKGIFIDVAWTPPPNEYFGARIELDGVKVAEANINQTSCSIPVKSTGEYMVRVVSLDHFNNDYAFEEDSCNVMGEGSPPKPGKLLIEEKVTWQQDGTMMIAAEVNFEGVNYPYLQHYLAEISVDGGDNWVLSQTSNGTKFIFSGLGEGKKYLFRVMAVSRSQACSPESMESFTPQGKFYPPEDVPRAWCRVIDQTVYLTWEQVPDKDISCYVVKRGSDWESGQIVYQGNTTSCTLGMIKGAFLFWIKAKDKTDRYSVNAAQVMASVVGSTRNVLKEFSDDFSTGAFDQAERYIDETLGPVLGTSPVATGNGWMMTGFYESQVFDLGVIRKARVWADFSVMIRGTNATWGSCSSWERLMEAGAWSSIFMAGVAKITLKTKKYLNDSWEEHPYFILGDVEAQYFQIVVEFDNKNTDNQLLLRAYTLVVDMDDLFDGGQLNVDNSGSMSMMYNKNFVSVKSVQACAWSTTHCFVRVDGFDNTHFKVSLWDDAGNPVGGAVTWTAVGY